jgi:intracellular sulfur oxidation DsrE/DsrF family protein
MSTVLLLTRDGMGTAEPALARKLAATYLDLLDLDGREIDAVCCYAEGVRLVLEGAPSVEPLRHLAARGVRVIVCGTCVNFYGVADRVAVGEVMGMKDIIAAQWGAKRVMTV